MAKLYSFGENIKIIFSKLKSGTTDTPPPPTHTHTHTTKFEASSRKRREEIGFEQRHMRRNKGPVKLIEWVKTASLLFLHVMSKVFQFTILNLSG